MKSNFLMSAGQRHSTLQLRISLINPEKSKVVHFRPKSVSMSSKAFKIGDKPISSVSNYMYLGLMLTEHLDYNVMAKNVSMSANRDFKI